MARIRTIKPGFFRHVALYDAEVETGLPLRLAFAGLWTAADREGRFAWEPRNLKLDVLPHDEVDFSRVLDALSTRGFVVRYTTPEGEFGYIPSWKKHQIINNRETASSIPEPPKNNDKKHKDSHASITRPSRVSEMLTHTQAEGEGKGNMEREQEGERKDTSAEPLTRSTPEAEPEPPQFLIRPFIALPTNKTGEEFSVMPTQVDEFVDLYPAVDVKQALRSMRGWLLSNPTQRKTAKGMVRFINGWLEREQNKGNRINGSGQRPTPHDNLQQGTILALERIAARH